jgi:hypothetical protein
MAKTKNPLFGFDARGTLANLLTFRHRDKQTIAENKPVPKDAKTSGQLAWRTMYQLCADLWHTLTPVEQATWETLARARHMTGYAYYLSQCLRPNPGIYLPLLGGTMQGDVVMASHRITDLPAAGANNDPLRKGDAQTFINGWTLNTLLKGAGAGAAPTEISGWQKLAETIVPSNCDYVHFNSLDINTDKFYLLLFMIKNPQVSHSFVYIYREGDYTNTNYYSQYLFAAGTSITAARLNNAHIVYVYSTGEIAGLAMITRTLNGNFLAAATTPRHPGSASEFEQTTLSSANTTANITSLRVAVSAAGAIGAGSILMLCKPRTS